MPRVGLSQKNESHHPANQHQQSDRWRKGSLQIRGYYARRGLDGLTPECPVAFAEDIWLGASLDEMELDFCAV